MLLNSNHVFQREKLKLQQYSCYNHTKNANKNHTHKLTESIQCFTKRSLNTAPARAPTRVGWRSSVTHILGSVSAEAVTRSRGPGVSVVTELCRPGGNAMQTPLPGGQKLE